QRRLWVLSRLEEGLAAYNMPSAIRIEGALNVEALEKALEGLANRHEILRTRFVAEEDGEPRQVIAPPAAFHLPRIDWRDKEPAETKAYLQAHANQVFDLSEGPLLKAELLHTGEGSHILLLNMHHIISDGWSMEVLLRELSALYDAAAKGEENPLPALKIQYKEYAAWQGELLSDNERMAELRGYWRAQLADLPVLELPADYPRPSVKSYRGGRLHHTFGPEVLEQLEKLSRESGASLFMALTALVKVLLYRYTNQEDILVGTPTSGRNHPDLHDQLGFYVNMLVLRDRLHGEEDFTQTLAQVKETALAAFERELYPFDRLVEELEVERDQSRNPVFDVMVVLQNNERSALKLGDTALIPIPGKLEASKFDLTFGFAAGAQGLRLDIEYSTDLFRRDRIERIAGHLETLLESVLANPAQPIGELNILPAAERDLLLNEFNDTRAEYPQDKTVVDLFEEQAERTPDNIAVVFEDRELAYRELNARANGVAHYLRERYDIQPDDVIALQLERSEWMVVAILGVLKAGAAYLPIAPDAPGARTRYMLEDSRAKALLTDEATYPVAKELEEAVAIKVIQQIESARQTNLQRTRHNPEDLAYVIYTSGSTGQPKGVMIEHLALTNFLWSMKDAPGIMEQDVLLSVTNYTFDISILEIGLPWLSGARMALASSSQQKHPALLQELVEKIRPTLFQATPSLWSILTNSEIQGLDRTKLLSGGEALPEQLAKELTGTGKEIWNLYGPTETTIWSSILLIKPLQRISIGKPIANTSMYILGEGLQVLPISVAGELYIGGEGLARGYLNNPALTAQKFIPHPFREGERLYRTGDLARWLPDGNIEFLGRIDHQLKVRGYRIEAGEVEQALLEHPAIKSAVVEGREMGHGKELAAYLVAGEGGLPGTEELRRHLSERLPGYMIPSYFVELEALPLTTSGKVDRKALPAPNAGSLASGAAYVPPRNSTEATLVEIWEAVLQRSGISIHDNFFDLGGHSLKAIQLNAKMTKAFNLPIPLNLIYQHPNIAALAAKIGASGEYHHQNGILYNPEAGQTVFAFPLFFGLAVSYQPLAALFTETAWYCFDFLEAGNRLELYYEQVKKHQPEGPYVFFGYSAGGNLAFEMARYMESRGEKVSGLIFGDSVVRLEKTGFDFKEYAAEIGVHGEAGVWGKVRSILLQNEIARKQAESRMTAYHHFLNHQAMDTPVRADIYLLEAQSGDEQEGSMVSRDWAPYTAGKFMAYPAQGAHEVLFEPPNLAVNTATIKKILSVIRDGKSGNGHANGHGDGKTILPGLSPEAETAIILALGRLATEHFEQGGHPFNFSLEGLRKTWPREVEAIEGYLEQHAGGAPAGEGTLAGLAQENRELFAQLLRLQQEMESM
ncbi:MAG: amino acid adenylation domain-containing protein, partial [Phaeodactylibacter sp.]|nr:amino acid adenylation domain-containing protein [Phaeodactylibacter sp.]